MRCNCRSFASSKDEVDKLKHGNELVVLENDGSIESFQNEPDHSRDSGPYAEEPVSPNYALYRVLLLSANSQYSGRNDC